MQIEPLPNPVNNDTVKEMMTHLDRKIERAFTLPPSAPVHDREWLARRQQQMIEATRPIREMQKYLYENFVAPVAFKVTKWPDLNDD